MMLTDQNFFLILEVSKEIEFVYFVEAREIPQTKR